MIDPQRNGEPSDDDLDGLDEDFPLGDGIADTEAVVQCPYCATEVEITLDPGSGVSQEYVEDCEVCCQPWRVMVHYGPDGSAEVEIEALDEEG